MKIRYNFWSPLDEQFNYFIDNEEYFFKTTLISPDGNIVPLTKTAIMELKLVDSIFVPHIHGTVILTNREDSLERFVLPPTDEEFTNSTGTFLGYTVRGDARDLLRLEIVPLEKNRYEFFAKEDIEYNKIYTITNMFCLGNEEPLQYNGEVAKKYDIIDFDKQILSERRSYFSTVELLKDLPDVTQLSNKGREVETGKCINLLIRKGLNDEEAINDEIDTDIETVTIPYFEDGTSKINYSSPAQNSTYDDIMYILKRHTSSSGSDEYSFLQKENYTGEYTLQGSSIYFQKAYEKDTKLPGPYFLENLVITGSSKKGSSPIEIEPKKPLKAAEFGEKGDIIEYDFFNTSGSNWQNLINTHIVHSYDNLKKSFDMEAEGGYILNAKDQFKRDYVDVMRGKNDEPYPNFITDIMQKDNFNYTNVFSEYFDNDEIIRSYGVNALLKDALITNLGVEIIVKGQVYRKAGRFFSIDRSGDYIESKFDNKLLGIYFLASVEHIFQNDNEYFNKLIGFKTYHWEDPDLTEDTV
jgi:hypothetical protein